MPPRALLIDPLTLDVYRHVPRPPQPGPQVTLSTLTGDRWVGPQHELEPLGAQDAALALSDLLQQPRWSQQVALDLAPPEWQALLGAATPEAFVDALGTLYGTHDPAVLEPQLERLDAHARHAQHLLAGGLSPAPHPDADTPSGTPVSPALLTLLALLRAAPVSTAPQPGSPAAADLSPAPPAAPRLNIAAPQLEFSEARMRAVLRGDTP